MVIIGWDIAVTPDTHVETTWKRVKGEWIVVAHKVVSNTSGK